MKTSILYYCAFAFVVLGSVLFGLDWQPATMSPMPPIQVVDIAATAIRSGKTCRARCRPDPGCSGCRRTQARRPKTRPSKSACAPRRPLRRLRKRRRRPNATWPPAPPPIVRSVNRIAPITPASVSAGCAPRAWCRTKATAPASPAASDAQPSIMQTEPNTQTNVQPNTNAMSAPAPPPIVRSGNPIAPSTPASAHGDFARSERWPLHHRALPLRDFLKFLLADLVLARRQLLAASFRASWCGRVS